MKKRLLILLCAVVCAMQLLAATHTVTVDEIKYTVDTTTGRAAVARQSPYLQKDNLVIPDRITYNGQDYRVTTIGNDAFDGCRGLTGSLTIPNSVTEIGESAFNRCYSLTSVVIGNSVTSIGDQAFNGCSGLKKVHISDIAAWCRIAFKDEFSNPLFYAGHLFLNGNEVTNLVIPNSVTEISNYAFADCSSLTSVVIGNSVNEIGNYAFADCSSLTSVVIGNSVNEIGDYAFYNCPNITELTSLALTPPAIYSNSFSETNYNTTYVSIPTNTLDKYQETPWSAFKHLVETGSEVSDFTLEQPGTLLTKFNISEVNSITSLKISGKINGTDLLTLNKMINLRSLDISDATIVSGGMNYYEEDNQKYGTTDNTLGNYWAYALEFLSELKMPANLKIIENNAFKGKRRLTSLTIPNSVTEIGEYAFYGCSGLTSVTIGNSVTSIGNYAFDDCSGLTSLTIPNSVTSIGYYAFSHCSGLTSITIPNSVTSIGERAFDYCSRLKEVHISDIAAWCGIDFKNRYSNPLYYAHHLFLNGEEVTDLVIPNSVTSIGSSTFFNCSGLTSVSIGHSVNEIGNYAFNGCDGLTELVIENGDNILKLGYNYYANKWEGKGLFYDCPLETLYLGRNLSYNTDPNYGYRLSTYEYSPFSGKASLKKLTIGNSVTTIDNYAFNGCSALTSLVIEDGNQTLALGYNEPSGEGLFYDCPLETLYLGRNLSYNTDLQYGYSPFYGKDSLKELTIGNSVTEIGAYAFSHCSSLTEVIIGNSVTSIGICAFSGCSGLTGSLTIPKSVTSIGYSAFFNCSGLTSVSIGHSVTEIEVYAFNGCSALTSLVIEDGNQSISLGYNHISESYYENGKGLFYDCPLETLYLGRDLIYDAYSNYGYSPFYGKTSLKEVTIGNSVSKIGNYAFAGCNGLAEVTIGNSVTEIGVYAFNGCSGLTSVSIPNSVTEIEVYAFNGCSGLKKVHISDIAAWCRIAFKDEFSNPLFYAGHLFLNGNEITNLVIPNSVTEISNYAFADCSSLTSVVLPMWLTTIGQKVFSGCLQLASITIPGGVRYIRSGAFKGCTALESVNMINPIPAVIDEDSFDFNGTLNVPEESLMYYWIHPLWGKFPNLQAWNVGTDIDFVNEDGNSTTFHITSEESATVEVTAATLLSRAPGELTIPETVTYNGKDYTVAGIANNAFQNMAFEAIELPKTISYVGLNAFSGCSALRTLTVNAQLPPSAARESFDDNVFATTTLIVPEEATEAYEEHDIWKLFANKEYVDIDEFDAPADDAPMEVYDMRGVKVGDSLDGLPHGVYILRQGSKTTKHAI